MLESVDGPTEPLPEEDIQEEEARWSKGDTPKSRVITFRRKASFRRALGEIDPDWIEHSSRRSDFPRRTAFLRLMEHQAKYHQKIDDWDLDFLSYAQSVIHPASRDVVGETLETWGVENRYINAWDGRTREYDRLWFSDLPCWDYSRVHRRLDLLVYEVTFPPKQTTVVEVRYSHLVNADLYPVKDVNQREGPGGTYFEFQHAFQYILRTSSRWNEFGPITINLTLDTIGNHGINLPMTLVHHKGEEYTYTLEIPRGSNLNQNLHVGFDALVSRETIPGLQVAAGTYWEGYKSDTHGPLADKFLQKTLECLVSNGITQEDREYWVAELGVDAGAEGDAFEAAVTERLRGLER